MSGDTLSSEAEQLRRLAADLAGGLSRSARRAATIAQERAVLRMLGVDGLDRAGRPLAASLAERYCGSNAGRLARGVILPFAVALLEYDMPARDLALDGASGAIDLGLEAELLGRPDRLAAAEKKAAELLGAALSRFDANRTATRDMRDVLGLPREPWLGVALRATEVEAAAEETRAAIAEGADVIQVRVPASWEFAEARRHAGLDTPGLFEPEATQKRRRARRTWRRGARPARQAAEPVPAGSQRGLASLRKAADDAAARRRCYAGLMTVTSAFAAPEQAVVAGFERIDFVGADPIREIVEENVDPERALADHAFAHRLQARAGCRVVVGPGPLALGADVASGIPSDATTWAARALALQALGVELAVADGLPADRLLLSAIPDWAFGDADEGSILLQAWLRRAIFPGQALVLDGPTGWLGSPGRAVAVVSAFAGGAASLVVEPGVSGRVSAASAELASAARTARMVRATLGDGALHGDAAELGAKTLRAASGVLAMLSAEGWESLLGPAGHGADGDWLGASAVVERDEGPTSGARLFESLA
ncbi:MAG: lysine 5,6-aminomutase subunit alpha [Candidatus Limnocylindrales bacterium]